ncbi:MAG: DMT family transporter [Boseongicola sp. SB0662_bin_57]|nr:DMT family transporter [Boseongicola sp. SB0662_bin_57]
MNEHLKGLLITTLGVLLVVPDSLFVRLIEAEPMVTAFWRGATAGFVVLMVLLAVQGVRGFRAVLHTGWPGLIYTVLMGTAAPAFVFAVTQTSVANVVFIFASMPVFAAIFSRIVLGEPIRARMVTTMAAVILGLGIIAHGSGETEIASWKGDIWAVYISAAFAAALTAVRKVKATSMIPAIPVAYLGSAIALGMFVSPREAFEAQWPLFLGHGAFIGAASCLLALGPRYVSAAEVALIVLLESVLAPILVWLAIGEDPGPWAVVGGAVVVGALLVSNVCSLVKQEARQHLASIDDCRRRKKWESRCQRLRTLRECAGEVVRSRLAERNGNGSSS